MDSHCAQHPGHAGAEGVEEVIVKVVHTLLTCHLQCFQCPSRLLLKIPFNNTKAVFQRVEIWRVAWGGGGTSPPLGMLGSF